MPERREEGLLRSGSGLSMGWQGAGKSAQPSLRLLLPYMPTQGTLANPILRLSCNHCCDTAVEALAFSDAAECEQTHKT